MMSSRISPPGVGELSRRFGDTLASLIKGISADVSVAGLYLLIYRWVLGVHASYWCAGGKGPRCEVGVVGGSVSIVPQGDSGTLGSGGYYLCR
jgi:hypothetical protein